MHLTRDRTGVNLMWIHKKKMGQRCNRIRADYIFMSRSFASHSPTECPFPARFYLLFFSLPPCTYGWNAKGNKMDVFKTTIPRDPVFVNGARPRYQRENPHRNCVFPANPSHLWRFGVRVDQPQRRCPCIHSVFFMFHKDFDNQLSFHLPTQK